LQQAKLFDLGKDAILVRATDGRFFYWNEQADEARQEIKRWDEP